MVATKVHDCMLQYSVFWSWVMPLKVTVVHLPALDGMLFESLDDPSCESSSEWEVELVPDEVAKHLLCSELQNKPVVDVQTVVPHVQLAELALLPSVLVHCAGAWVPPLHVVEPTDVAESQLLHTSAPESDW
jgi:hypothetical protein